MAKRERERTKITKGKASKHLPAHMRDKNKYPFAGSAEIDEVVDFVDKNNAPPTPDVLEELFPGYNHSPIIRKEVLMSVIFQLRLRGLKGIQIANKLNKSPQFISHYVSLMGEQFENEVANLSFLGQVGSSIATFKELQSQATKLLYSEKTTNKIKLRALRDAAYLEHSVLHVLSKSGFFSASRLTPRHSKTTSESELGLLQKAMMNVLEGNTSEKVIDMVEETPDNYAMSEKDVSLARL